MDPVIRGAIPVLPAADTTESLNWWTEVCGFKEAFRDATPPTYVGIKRGEAYLHIAGMSDEELADQVRQDGIDILFDLSGHTGDNRLLTFARKPAPVQVSWVGNPNTTGLKAMDYYLADRFSAPPGLLASKYAEP